MTSLRGFGKYYQIAYSIVFSIAFITYFMRRFLIDQHFFYLTTCSLILSSMMFLVYIFRKGWRIHSLFACLAACVFLLLMPYSVYTVDKISDFSIISFFLLSVSIDPEDTGLMKRIFHVKLVVAIAVLGAYLAKFIPDVVTVRQYVDHEVTRHSYGFMHPNSLGMYFVSILFDVALMNKKRLFSDFIILTASALLIYAVTNSRTAMLLSIGGLVLILFKPLLIKVRLNGMVLMVAVLGVFATGIYLSYSYDINNSQYEFINQLLSNRLRGAHAYIEQYGFSLYPRRIEAISWMNGTVVANENFYIDSLLSQGMIVFSLFPIVLLGQLFNRRFSLYHALLFTMCLVSAMIEEYGVSLFICSPLLLNYFAQEIDDTSDVSDEEEDFQDTYINLTAIPE